MSTKKIAKIFVIFILAAVIAAVLAVLIFERYIVQKSQYEIPMLSDHGIVYGDTTAEVISAIIADEISIGVVNNKTTAVRVIPAVGKSAGDEVCYGGLLGSAPIMEINTKSPARFITRGGRIPAPMHSQRN